MHWIRENVAPSIAARDRAGEHGLRRPRDVLEQHVAAADERGEDELDLLRLPVDDGLDVRAAAAAAMSGAEPTCSVVSIDPPIAVSMPWR